MSASDAITNDVVDESGWTPSGLRVVEAAVSEAVEALVLSLAEEEMLARPNRDSAHEQDGPRIEMDSTPLGRSRVLRLGYDQSGGPIGDARVPWWSYLIHSLLSPEIRARFDSVAICEFQPGCGIDAHADSPVYTGTTTVLCLGADATLTMRPRPSADDSWSRDRYSIALPRRCLYSMSGEALERCTHEILVPSAKKNERGERTRISIVFRDAGSSVGQALLGRVSARTASTKTIRSP